MELRSFERTDLANKGVVGDFIDQVNRVGRALRAYTNRHRLSPNGGTK